jgi:hypothetical protein
MFWLILFLLSASVAHAVPTIPPVGNLYNANGSLVSLWADDHQNTLVDGGTTFYFANGGNDGGNCQSSAAPCASLARMRAVRCSGCNMLFKRGSSWTGTIEAHTGPNGTATNYTTYGAWGDPSAARPVFNGGRASQNFNGKSYIWVDRHNWRNHGVPRVQAGSHHITLSYLHQQDAWQTGFQMSASNGGEAHHVTIANSNFDRVGLENVPCIVPGAGENWDGHEGIYISSSVEADEGGDDVHVYNTRIGPTTKEAFNVKDNADRNTFETMLVEGGYIQCDDPYVISAGDFFELGTTIFRNIVVRGRRFHSHVGSGATAVHVGQNHKVENIIVSDVPFGCVRFSADNANTVVSNILCHNVNAFFRSGTTSTQQNKVFNSIGTTVNGNLAYSSGLFINAGVSDFRHASATSGGINLYSNCRGVTRDLQGNARPQGGNCDAGPFERGTGDTPPPPPPPPPPTGPDLFVRKTGNDTTGTGTTELPFLTIQKCVDVVAAETSPDGHSCSIGTGTYVENVVVSNIKAASFTTPFTIKAEPGAAAVLRPASGTNALHITDDSLYVSVEDGPGQLAVDGANITGSNVRMDGHLGFTGSSADHIRLSGIEIKNGPGWCIFAEAGTAFNEYLNLDLHGCVAGMSIAGRFSVIQHNFIHDMPAGFGIFLFFDGTSAPNNTAIRQNSIFNVSEGIGIQHGTEITVYNNLIFLNDKGIQLYDADLNNIYIYYNSIASNTISGIDINAGVGESFLWGNIVYGNGTNIVDDSGNSTLADNLTTDPMFAEVAMGNLTLLDGSAAVDALTCIPGITEDFAGAPRPQPEDGDCDIGAYEGTADPAPPPPPGPVTGGRKRGGKMIGGISK